MECVWNPIGVRTKVQPKNRWRVVIIEAKKQKLRNWSQIVKKREAWNYLVIEDPNLLKVYCQKKKKKKKKRRRTRRRSLFISSYTHTHTHTHRHALSCKCVIHRTFKRYIC